MVNCIWDVSPIVGQLDHTHLAIYALFPHDIPNVSKLSYNILNIYLNSKLNLDLEDMVHYNYIRLDIMPAFI